MMCSVLGYIRLTFFGRSAVSRYRNSLLAVLVLVVLSTILAVANPFAGQGQGQGLEKGPQVTVANTPEQPVPTTVEGGEIDAVVSGEVSVSNFPATQQVAGTVLVGNLPGVQAVTGNLNVTGEVAVTNLPSGGSRQPVSFSFNDNIDSGGNANFRDVFTVPDDRYLVIEYVSFRAFAGLNLDSETRVSLRVITTVGGNYTDHLISPVPLVSREIGEQRGGHLVKIYADPGSTVTMIANRGCCGGGTTFVRAEVTGFLTDQI